MTDIPKLKTGRSDMYGSQMNSNVLHESQCIGVSLVPCHTNKSLCLSCPVSQDESMCLQILVTSYTYIYDSLKATTPRLNKPLIYSLHAINHGRPPLYILSQVASFCTYMLHPNKPSVFLCDIGKQFRPRYDAT